MEIRLEIGVDGTYTFEVKGVKGQKCTDLRKEFERAIGKATNVRRTSEFFQQQSRTVQQKGG